jgi:hypothetical protein
LEHCIACPARAPVGELNFFCCNQGISSGAGIPFDPLKPEGLWDETAEVFLTLWHPCVVTMTKMPAKFVRLPGEQQKRTS